MTSEFTDYKKYTLMFSGLYLGFILLLIISTLMFDFEPSAGIGLSLVIAIAITAGGKFAGDMNRLPEKSEKRKLACCLLIGIYAVSILFAVVGHMAGSFDIYDLLNKNAPLTLLLIMVFCVGLHYLVLSFGIKWGAKISLKKPKAS